MIVVRSRTALTFAAALAISTASFAVACSSAPPPGDPPLSGELNQNRGTGNKTGNDTSSSSSSSGGTNKGTDQSTDPNEPADPAQPGDPAPTGGACSNEQTADACFQCCDTKNPGGLDVDGQAFGQCACETPGVCAQACGSSYCAGQEPTQACVTCLQNATQCETAAETACNANAACKAALTCIQQSGCEQKP